MKHFNEYKRLDLAALSREVLAQWEKEGLFEKSISTREGHTPFLFFEGPPSANGKPGIHHVMARTIKDTFCRFKTMQGYQVRRKAGWDTHGLPVELGVEKMLGITKEDIGKKISVDEYNAACSLRSQLALANILAVLRYMDRQYLTQRRAPRRSVPHCL